MAKIANSLLLVLVLVVVVVQKKRMFHCNPIFKRLKLKSPRARVFYFPLCACHKGLHVVIYKYILYHTQMSVDSFPIIVFFTFFVNKFS